MTLSRRSFLTGLTGAVVGSSLGTMTASAGSPAPSAAAEGLMEYLQRVQGGFDEGHYRRLLGAANEFKEGDAIVGVAAADDAERQLARQLLAATRLGDINAHPLLVDDLYRQLQTSLNREIQQPLEAWTFAELKAFLLTEPEASIHAIMPGLSSDVIGCVVKLLSNAELTAPVVVTAPSSTNTGS